MTIIITTESGSRYELDPDQHRYRKVSTANGSLVPIFAWTNYSTLMSRHIGASGYATDEFEQITPEDVKPGIQLFFQGRGYDDWVRTSPVVNVERA